MSLFTYRITILGCRVNHAEARELESVLLERDLSRAQAHTFADFEVIHTCSVTATAVRKSRNAIRRSRKGRSTTQTHTVIVTGCFAGTDSHSAAVLAHSHSNVIPHHAENGSTMVERFAQRIDEILEELLGIHHDNTPIRSNTTPCSTSNTPLEVHSLPLYAPVDGAGNHIRAELKIQDGCDAYCSFCILPSIRKTLRSKTVENAVLEAQMLVDLGHKEIVLTGIFIGAYGHETALRRNQRDSESEHLADLLDAISNVSGIERLRISSMEPGDVTEVLLDSMVANSPVVVPHLHLPLQSGSDSVLRKMNRQYQVCQYLEMVDMVNSTIATEDGLPPAITTDIICGFPGETEEDFKKTVEVAEKVGYLHMHVFPFSPRQGTAAARWKNQFLSQEVIKERVKQLIDMELESESGFSITYRKKLLGRTIRVMLEQPDKNDSSIMTGRCDHYALIHLTTDKSRGSLLNATVTEVTPTHTIAEVAEPSHQLTVLSSAY